MDRGRRLNKSGGGELKINKQNVVTSDEGTVVPNVALGDEAIVEPHVIALDAAIVEQNIVASDVAIA